MCLENIAHCRPLGRVKTPKAPGCIQNLMCAHSTSYRLRKRSPASAGRTRRGLCWLHARRLECLGAPRAAYAARQLGQLANPRRPRFRQDAHWGRMGPREYARRHSADWRTLAPRCTDPRPTLGARWHRTRPRSPGILQLHPKDFGRSMSRASCRAAIAPSASAWRSRPLPRLLASDRARFRLS